MTVFKYATLRNLRSPLSLLANVVAPIVLIVMASNIWTQTPVMGLVTMVVLMIFSSHLLANLILEDRIDGSIIKVLISPVGASSYLFQNLLATIMPSIFQIILLGILGLVQYNWETDFLVGVVVTLFIFSITNTAFSFCWNMFFKNKSASRYAYMVVSMIIMLLSGVLVPIELLPTLLQNVGAIFPPYWIIRAFNEIATYGLTKEFWLFQAILILFAVGFLLLGGKRRAI